MNFLWWEGKRDELETKGITLYRLTLLLLSCKVVLEWETVFFAILFFWSLTDFLPEVRQITYQASRYRLYPLDLSSDPQTMFTRSNMCVKFPRVFLPLMLKPQESLNPNGKRCYISNCDNMKSSTSIIVFSDGRVLQN
jgi:hypothetical protein